MLELKRVPGRKTDVKDSEWLAQLLECGLLQPSFVPPPPIRELRDFTRYQVQQVRDRSQVVNRLCKVLEDAGIKLTSVVSDVMGKSGRAMLHALVDGTTDPPLSAELARGKLRAKLPALRRALQGRFRAHHAFLVEQIFAKIDFLDDTLDRITTEIDQRLVPFAPMLTRLDTIPGVNRISAISIVAETGGDMTPVPHGAPPVQLGRHVSWPQRKRGQAPERQNPHSQSLLARRADSSAAGRHTQERLGLASEISPRRDAPRAQVAVVAVGHQILEIAFYIMRDGVTYDELGADYFDRRHSEQAVRRHVSQLEALGFHVTIEKAA